MYCSKCGEKIEGNFCTHCGTEAGQIVKDSPIKVTDNKHNTYRLVVGIIMLILGSIIFMASLSEETVAKYEIIGYDITMGFMIPGIVTLVGGVLSIVSRKENNTLLLLSGICYVAAAVSNCYGIKDISLLFIMCCVFSILNFVFYTKSNKQTN